MITPDFRKKMADSWFSYLQIQICKEFSQLEKNKVKFTKRDWNKKRKKEGGGTSYLLSGGKIFDKVGVNKSTVSGSSMCMFLFIISSRICIRSSILFLNFIRND